MSSNSNPPLGSGYALPTDDPDEPMEQRRGNRSGDVADQVGAKDRELPGTARTLEEQAEQIVEREQGVTSFADAEDIDRMERPLSANDRERVTDGTGNVVSDTIASAWNGIRNPDTDQEKRRD